MFVKFRRTPMRLAASLVESRRVDGAVRPEHIASLGSIALDPMTVAGRVAYWHELHKRLDKLGNRVGDEKLKILDAIHAQVPMVTLDEIRVLQRKNFESDERVWSHMRDMQQERAAALKARAEALMRDAAEAEAHARVAGEKAGEAKEKLDKLDKGEAVKGGLGEPMTLEQWEQVLRAEGATIADIRHRINMATLTEDEFEKFLEESIEENSRLHERRDHARVRKMLRDREA
jgi:DNA-binding transcriptional MerR regulator